MKVISEQIVQVPIKELNKVLDAYHTIGRFLEHHIDLKMLYKEEFMKGMDTALNEVKRKKIKKVDTFRNFIE